MARTRAQMRAQTTAKLIEAARAVFSEVGYAQASTEQLCARIGLSRGALYHNFGSKEGLFEAVVTQVEAEMSARLEQVWMTHDDPWEAFQWTCLAYLEMALEPEVQRVYLLDAPAVLGQRLREIDTLASMSKSIEALQQAIDTGQVRFADPEVLARLLAGAMMEAALWIASSEDPKQTFKRAVEGLLVMMGGLSRSGQSIVVPEDDV